MEKQVVQVAILSSAVTALAVSSLASYVINKQAEQIQKMAADAKVVRDAVNILLDEGSFESETINKVYEQMEFRLITREF